MFVDVWVRQRGARGGGGGAGILFART